MAPRSLVLAALASIVVAVIVLARVACINKPPSSPADIAHDYHALLGQG